MTKGKQGTCLPNRTYGCCLRLPFVLIISSVICDAHGQHISSAKVQVVHPFQSMVLRATDISPIIFYGENGRVHMEYRPILPKVLYTVSVLGELMRGVGATVNEVLYRAALSYPGPHYGTLHSPYYYYPHPHQHAQEHPQQLSNIQSSSSSDHHTEQRRHHENPTPAPQPIAVSSSSPSPPPSNQMSMSSEIRTRFIRPPNAMSVILHPPSPPQQNVLEVISKAIAGAR